MFTSPIREVFTYPTKTVHLALQLIRGAAIERHRYVCIYLARQPLFIMFPLALQYFIQIALALQCLIHIALVRHII